MLKTIKPIKEIKNNIIYVKKTEINNKDLLDKINNRIVNKSKSSVPLPLIKKANEIGFIILRHVNSEETNKYWQICYDSIRTFYPENNILIIDDNSNYDYISEKQLYKTSIIQSEYPKRGELLPYYYYLKNKFADIAVILHDSVFIQKYIDFSVDKYKFIWEFDHIWDQPKNEIKILNVFKNNDLINFYNNKRLWKGCFGGMSIITHDFLTYVDSKYKISHLIPLIINRDKRCYFERVIACILQKEHKNTELSLLGVIHNYCPWGLKFNEKDNYNTLPLLKVWTGR